MMGKLLRSAVAMAAFGLQTGASAAAPQVGPDLLPANVTPQRYDLHVRTDAKALTFSGDLDVTVAVAAPTPDVTLNAEDLVFDRASLDGAPGAVTLDAIKGRATLHFAHAITAGSHHLRIAYHGAIGRSTLGFFAMDYATPQGPRRTIATNFEPAAARRFLPCWDEPERKAVFAVTVDAPADRMAVSNMPVSRVTPLPGGLQEVSFAPTPKMSSYLLFVGIGDWERIHATTDGVDVGVVVARGETEKGRYALEQATRLLHWYDGWFGTAYPLPKLDLIVAPGEIAGGSMENWGAIFYSQEHLLFDPAKGTPSDRQLVFEVVAHEMSHQWFGDLVTMRWWSDLWLNEGFARWMQTYAADALHPEWRTGLQAQGVFEQGKDADAEVSTHPVLQPIDTVAQAADALDSITYDKGAAVITMISAYVGDDRFREGVGRYIKAHAYGNTVDTDLWSIMQEVAGKPILKVEADFTRQAGLPLVHAAPTGAGGLSLTEDRFHADAQAAVSNERWSLPLTVTPAAGTRQELLLQDRAEVGAGPGAVVNAGQTGYARVLYADSTFAPLPVRMPMLHAVDQLGLINDAHALGLAGYAPESRTLFLTGRLPSEADPIVWSRVISVLREVDDHHADGAGREAFRLYARRLLSLVAVPVGREARPNEDAAVTSLRGQLLPALAAFGDAEVVAWARTRRDDPRAPAAERRAALAIYAASVDRAGFDSLLAQAASTVDPLEKVRLYQALAGTSDPVSARKLLDLALSGAMPTGANMSIIARLSHQQPDLVWTVAVPHLDDPRAGITANYQRELVGYIASQSANPALVADLDNYERTKVPESARRPFSGYVATVRRNARIRQEVMPEVDRWIVADGGNASSAMQALGK